MTDEERREAAEQLILEFAKDIEYGSVREHLSQEVGDYSEKDVAAVYILIAGAKVTVTF